MTSAPSLEPAIAGVKVMLIVHSAPGGRVAPQLCVSPKSMPEGMMSVIVTGVAPALVSVTVCGELFLPTGCVPKSSCSGVILTVGALSAGRWISWALAPNASRTHTVLVNHSFTQAPDKNGSSSASLARPGSARDDSAGVGSAGAGFAAGIMRCQASRYCSNRPAPFLAPEGNRCRVVT